MLILILGVALWWAAHLLKRLAPGLRRVTEVAGPDAPRIQAAREAGAIPPTTAFRYAFLHGADFVLAGMFDYEIADDVKTATEAVKATTGAKR